MPVATGLALGLGIASAAGGVASAAIGSHAAGKAAKEQSTAAMDAAQLEHDSADKALSFQEKQYNEGVQRAQPWVTAGTGAINTLSGLMSPGGDLTKQFGEQFQAPTDVTEQNDPGFQFRLQEGERALQNSAAAKGGLLSGNTARAMQQYGQDYASNEYNNVYNRDFNEYATRYNQFKQNQTDTYNRYAGIAGLGQQTASQLNNLGETSATNSGNILMNSANQQGNQLNNAAAARASGYVGSANAYGGLLNNIPSYLSLLMKPNQNSGSFVPQVYA